MRASGSVSLRYWYKSTNTDAEGAAGAVCARVAQFTRFTGTKVPILTQKALQALYAREWLKILDDLNTAPAIRDLEVVLVLKDLLYWYQSTCFISESWTT